MEYLAAPSCLAGVAGSIVRAAVAMPLTHQTNGVLRAINDHRNRQ